ncbi:hypothetical protein D1007_29314 [Hordeum vulgare]|nr:hypothetical protein D1007_29314 [Hordeum vulgare]
MMGVEDGQRPDRHPRQKRAPVASLGCHGLPRGGQGRDHDGEDNGATGPVATVRGKTCYFAAVVPRLSPRLPRPLASVAADVHAAAEAVLAEPLEFDKEALDMTPGEALQLDAFSPTLSASVYDFGQFNRATPSAARTLEVQLGALTSRVCKLEIVAPDDTAKAASLFRAPELPLLNRPTSAPRRSTAPPKSRAISAPTRHGPRQAACGSTVPVTKRASLRIVKELGLLGPKEKMMAEVAKALLHRFEEPLTDSDIAVIAKLTRLDGEVLRVMTRMAGSDGIAQEAIV